VGARICVTENNAAKCGVQRGEISGVIKTQRGKKEVEPEQDLNRKRQDKKSKGIK
jgi:hypothetical protein